MASIKELKKDAVPSINNPTKILKSNKEESIRLERKKLVDKLLADYEERQKNEGRLKSMVNKYPCFFSPKIDPNAKLGDKLKLLKAIDNPESYCPPKKRKMTTKSMLGNVEVLPYKQASSSKEQVIQISAVKGGLMLHALPQIGGSPSNTCFENNTSDDENEIIIVTEDEATYDFNLTVDTEKHKENNTEVIIVSSSKETEDMDTAMHVESESTDSLTKTLSKPIDSNKCFEDQFKNNKSSSNTVCNTQVTLCEDKGCQVIIPCKGCEQRSLKINKLLRERTRMLRDLNQNGIWKDPDEINTLKKLNGVLSLLLLQCIGEKYGKKSRAIRVDIVQDSIERINRGWSMQETSETLCQVLSANAYDELARSFSIINEV
ncbi:Hypothetical protein CINCED_3A018126 [Cinara cedri]|nr:Hypothetical protein CINCED_3A018126 [Cinara cedri]